MTQPRGIVDLRRLRPPLHVGTLESHASVPRWDSTLLDSLLAAPATRLAIAIGIGLLTGTERERRMAERGRRGPAGIRTFALVALLGGMADQLGGNAFLAVALAFVSVAALAGYFREPGDVGVTTEVALVVTFLLGVLAQREPALAAGLGVVVTVLLATRSTLHEFAGAGLTDEEVRDALLLGACALVVLPLLPDRPIDPAGLLNPFLVWRLVVLLLAISGAGYVAVRTLGLSGGLPLAGLVGGFVSSAATVNAMGVRSAAAPLLLPAAIAGALLSSVATFAQLALILAATSAETLVELRYPLVLGGGTAALGGGIAFAWARRQPVPASGRVEYGRAFDLKSAAILALTMSAVSVVSVLASTAAGAAGLFATAAVSGFADVHAAAIGVASVAASGAVSAHDAAIAVEAAVATNVVTKVLLALMSGGPRFGVPVGLGLVAALAAGWVGLALS